MTENRVSIIGLGKVGVTLAASLANAGAKVIGFDLSERVVSDIEQSKFKTNEPDVENLVNSTLHKDLFVTDQIENAVLNSDISFVIVPTPK